MIKHSNIPEDDKEYKDNVQFRVQGLSIDDQYHLLINALYSLFDSRAPSDKGGRTFVIKNVSVEKYKLLLEFSNLNDPKQTIELLTHSILYPPIFKIIIAASSSFGAGSADSSASVLFCLVNPLIISSLTVSEYIENLQTLIKAGCDFSIQNEYGQNFFYLLYSTKNASIIVASIQTLIKHDIDITPVPKMDGDWFDLLEETAAWIKFYEKLNFSYALA